MVRDRLCARLTLLAAGILISTALEATAQPLGAFRWQLLPYCNVITLNVTAQGTVFTLDGYDDQCGVGQHASTVGTAFPNPDGTIGIGLNTVLSPGGAFVHVEARISLASLGGPWHDSAGNDGTFVFTAGAGSGGPARPVAPNGIAPGSITNEQIAAGAVGPAQLAPGAIGSGQINSGQVQTRVAGTCPVGQYLRGVNANGTVVCEPMLVLNISTSIGETALGDGVTPPIAIGRDGLPMIAHYDSAAQRLRVTHCGNLACSTDNTTATLDVPPNEMGRFSAIAIGSDGLPVISYRDETTKVLRVTHCGNATCTAGNTSPIVDGSPGDVGEHTSIAIGVDGLPIVAHRDVTTQRLRITHCENLACTDVISTTADPASEGGENTAIAIGADGLPIVSHRRSSPFVQLRVTHCGNVACTAGNATTTVDAEHSPGQTAIAIGLDGLPIVAYRDLSAAALRVTHCGNAACSNDNLSTTVDDPPNDVGFFTAIAIGADGLPLITHHDATAGALRLTRCGNTTCTASNVSANVEDPAGDVGWFTAMAIGADGLPIITHRDYSANALRVTKCATRTCQ